MFDNLKNVDCSGCSACVQRCSTNCISMRQDEEGFFYPRLIDSSSCIDCRLCQVVCPARKEHGVPQMFDSAWMANAKDEELRKRSSSGGLFGALARAVLQAGGVVFGARYDDHFRVYHDCVDTPEELETLIGSKYSQSDLNDTFRRAEKMLKTGRMVLFTGLPCQIEGLRLFLKREYENLLMMDLFCYGVQSPMVWEYYLKSMGFADREIRQINMRSKRYGWKKYAMEIAFADGKEYLAQKSKDPYLRSYSSGLYVRESCHNCKYKGFPRMSDITAGDFWEVNEVFPGRDSRQGVSLVICNSERGGKWLERISSQVEFHAVDMKKLFEMQTDYLKPCAINRNRSMFFEGVRAGEPIKALVDRCVENSSSKTMIYEIKKMLFRAGLWKYIRPAWDMMKQIIKKD